MNLPQYTIKDLLFSGVHFGHHPRKWNPKMASYIFGVRSGIHIIDLEKTAPMLYQALHAIYDVVVNGGRVLLVGTKGQAGDSVKESALKCAQYYVNHRWLGGMLTNWKTVFNSIRRMKSLQEQMALPTLQLTKKERLKLENDYAKLERNLGGIKDMGGVPDILFVIDIVKEKTAVQEAKKLGIPVVGIVDTNADPEEVDYPIPGNDDASRAIEFYCQLVANTVLEALKHQVAKAGVDFGASEDIAETFGMMSAEGADVAVPEEVGSAEPTSAQN